MADHVENFRELYSTTLAPKLSELDKTRKSILVLIKKYIMISLVPLGISGYISILLETPIPIHCFPLEGKTISGDAIPGHITYFGGSTAQVSLEKDVSLLSNKKFCSSLRGPRQSLKFTLR